MPIKSTTEEFINKAKLKHGDLYDYSNVIYKSNRNKVIIICITHDIFEQLPSFHLQGGGCAKCARNNRKLTTGEFIKKANLKHGNYYDYSKVDYKNAKSKVIIICQKHGELEQNPNDHLRGNGCIECSINNKKLTKEEFIKRSKLKHGNYYDYSKVVYKNIMSKVIITCPKHGDFEQLSFNHLKGSGCSICSKIYSNISISWLKYIQFSTNKEIQNMLSPLGEYKIPTTFYKADGYCKETNTIYEFHGDFWHGNPKVFKPNNINPVSKKTYGELYEQTQNKKKKIMDLGYNYVEIWESNWKKAIKAIVKIQKIWRKYLKNFTFSSQEFYKMASTLG